MHRHTCAIDVEQLRNDTRAMTHLVSYVQQYVCIEIHCQSLSESNVSFQTNTCAMMSIIRVQAIRRRDVSCS